MLDVTRCGVVELPWGCCRALESFGELCKTTGENKRALYVEDLCSVPQSSAEMADSGVAHCNLGFRMWRKI